jgi:hypothetical protein
MGDVRDRVVLLLVGIVVAASSGGGARGEAPKSRDGIRGSSVEDNYAKVSVFGVEGTGNKFVYLFDRSASMEGAPLATAKRRLVESLATIDELQQFHVIFFNQRLMPLRISGSRDRIPFASDRNKKLATQFINSVKADGGTDRVAALRHALAIRPDVIFFLSDADDPMSAKEVAEVVQLNERMGGQICVIEFGRGDTKPKSNFLTQLARETGGQYAYVNVLKLKG